MKILLDSDIILVAYLNLCNYQKEVEFLWDMIESGYIKAYVTESGLEQVMYIVNKIANTETTVEEVFINTQDNLQILPINNSLCQQAIKLNFLDFNSALETVATIVNNLDAVVTLNPEHFTSSNIKVVSIIDLVCQYLESSFHSTRSESENSDHKEISNSGSLSNINRKPTDLSQWLQHKFDPVWQSIEEVFNFLNSDYSLRFCNNYSITRCKIINFLQIEFDEINIALVITIKSHNNNDKWIFIQIFPIGNSSYLLNGLQMIILNEFDNSLIQVVFREKDNCIQCELIAKLEESFSIKIVFKKKIIIEKFVIGSI